MYLVYLDEVKYKKEIDPYQWLCGLAFPEEIIVKVESQLSLIAEDYFGTSLLKKETEFHAKEILHGNGVYKGVEIQERVDLYKNLLDVIDQSPDIGRIAVRIDPEKLYDDRQAHHAFMHFVERINSYVKAKRTTALLISDHDKDEIASNVYSLSLYKSRGTDYQFGKEIGNVVDTIHHTHSHHSRLIQLADIYAFTMNLANKEVTRYPGIAIQEYAKTKGNLLFPSKYKYWPGG